MRVLIGTLVYRAGAYALDKFLANQKEIQQNYPGSELVLATAETTFMPELQSLINQQVLKGCVLYYKVERPVYAKSRLWNISSGRDTIRRYFLSQTQAQALLFLDSDMTFDSQIVNILEKEMEGYDAVFSGYQLKDFGIGLAGAGCLMLSRKASEKIQIRCIEFKNGDTIFEDNLIEMDLFSQRCRIKKGFFLSIDHFTSPIETKHTSPQRVGLVKQVTNHPLLRYGLLRMSVLFRRNIPWRLFVLYSRIFKN